MRPSQILALCGLLLVHPARAAELTLTAADAVKIYATETTPTAAAPRAVILLFHQAHASRQEYAPIAARLAQEGFITLAIDQRVGGALFGAPNQTAAAITRSQTYIDALPDLEATLAYAKSRYPTQKILVWGSSYSSALIFLLAAHHPNDIAGILSFSPGEYFDGVSIASSAAQIHTPVFIDTAATADEQQAAAGIFAAISASDKQLYHPTNGIHGSSTLRHDRDPAGEAENWAAVEAFLARVAPPK
jgi:alpha-beta hydrolase superfamily lysophospholipase